MHTSFFFSASSGFLLFEFSWGWVFLFWLFVHVYVVHILIGIVVWILVVFLIHAVKDEVYIEEIANLCSWDRN